MNKFCEISADLVTRPLAVALVLLGGLQGQRRWQGRHISTVPDAYIYDMNHARLVYIRRQTRIYMTPDPYVYGWGPDLVARPLAVALVLLGGLHGQGRRRGRLLWCWGHGRCPAGARGAGGELEPGHGRVQDGTRVLPVLHLLLKGSGFRVWGFGCQDYLLSTIHQ